MATERLETTLYGADLEIVVTIKDEESFGDGTIGLENDWMRPLAENLAFVAGKFIAGLADDGADEDELRLIFLAVAVLQAKFPDASFNECLDTAIVWCRG